MDTNSKSGSNIVWGYAIALSWYALSLVISNANDLIHKELGSTIHPIQVTFLRFLFGTLVLLPFMLYNGRSAFATSRPFVHISRGALLFGGIALYSHGLQYVHLTVANVINFTIPIFILILAIFFLNERVGWARWLATIGGFLGILVVLEPTKDTFNPDSLWLLIAALMFAMLDITNKKYVVKESMLAMLFYTALITMLFGLIPAIAIWQPIPLAQYGLIALVGCGANLLLFCLLKAFARIDASALAPFRYIELLLAAGTGYYFFGEIPKETTWLGATIIIPSTFFIIWYDVKRTKPQRSLTEENIEAKTPNKQEVTLLSDT